MRDIVNEIVEVKALESALRKQKEELEVLKDCILEEIEEICKEMQELETEEKRLKEEFRKEHTREFLRLMDEDDIREKILFDGSIKGLKFQK